MTGNVPPVVEGTSSSLRFRPATATGTCSLTQMRRLGEDDEAVSPYVQQSLVVEAERRSTKCPSVTSKVDERSEDQRCPRSSVNP